MTTEPGTTTTDAEALLREAMDAFSRRDLDHLLGLLDDDVVVEMPYEAGHGMARLDKARFREVLELLHRMYARFSIEFDRILPLEGGRGVVAEYHGDAEFKGSGVAYANTYCGIFLMEGGRITHWKEFDNPVVLREALDAHFAPRG